MNPLVFVMNDRVVTDSLTVAEVFGKNHKDVMRDIRTQIQYAGEVFSQRNFAPSEYTNDRGRTYKKYNLTEEAFTLVVFSYNTQEAVQVKIKFIQEFKRMKNELTNRSQPSYIIEDPIKRAEKWIEEQKQKKQLELVNQEMAPKAEMYDMAMSAKNHLTMNAVAKAFGYGRNKLFKLLREEGLLMQNNLPYQRYEDAGYFHVHLNVIKMGEEDPKTVPQTRVTSKGMELIGRILKEQGILV